MNKFSEKLDDSFDGNLCDFVNIGTKSLFLKSSAQTFPATFSSAERRKKCLSTFFAIRLDKVSRAERKVGSSLLSVHLTHYINGDCQLHTQAERSRKGGNQEKCVRESLEFDKLPQLLSSINSENHKSSSPAFHAMQLISIGEISLSLINLCSIRDKKD